MASFLSLFHNPFPLFLENFYWADLLIACLIVFLVYLVIVRKSQNILVKNIAYNKGLFAFRAEVYTNYEKNFFV